MPCAAVGYVPRLPLLGVLVPARKIPDAVCRREGPCGPPPSEGDEPPPYRHRGMGFSSVVMTVSGHDHLVVELQCPGSAFRIRALLSKGFLAEARKKKAAGRRQGAGERKQRSGEAENRERREQ